MDHLCKATLQIRKSLDASELSGSPCLVYEHVSLRGEMVRSKRGGQVWKEERWGKSTVSGAGRAQLPAAVEQNAHTLLP